MPLPDPVPGLVISYSFLWSHERQAGAFEGRKDRPSAIVVATHDEQREVRVVVAPITHRAPADERLAVAIPPAVCRQLGLDAAPCWVVCSELNRFTWPGFDLRPVPERPLRFAYGLLPRNLFETVRRRILDIDAALRALTPR
jgi:hypothetical protein